LSIAICEIHGNESDAINFFIQSSNFELSIGITEALDEKQQEITFTVLPKR
jgi:hypothetical protein